MHEDLYFVSTSDLILQQHHLQLMAGNENENIFIILNMGKGQRKKYEYSVFFSKKKHKLNTFTKMLPQCSNGFLIQQHSVNPSTY
jgi:hypothetical protein